MKTDQVTYDQTTSCTLASAPAWELTWALEWKFLRGITTQRKPTFMGTLVSSCVSTRVSTCGSPFVGALGVIVRFRQLCASLSLGTEVPTLIAFLVQAFQDAALGAGALWVLGPALNLSKNCCVFPCLDQAIGKTTIPNITRSGPKSPQWRLIVTSRRRIVTNQPKSTTNSNNKSAEISD